MNNIENMTKEELIQFTKNYNIFRCYDFPEFIATKNAVLKRLQELGMSTEDISFSRTASIDAQTIRVRIY